MKTEHKIVAGAVALGLLAASFAPVIPDPYYHQEKVNFWEWLRREIEELRTGEKA